MRLITRSETSEFLMNQSAGSNLAKLVCPSAKELSVIVNNVRCVECGLVFRNEPRLRLHDLKIHQRKNLDKMIKENVQYHCPVTSCVYALESQRFFTTMKYLKQHFLKVHAEKTFACTHCSKRFSTRAAKDAHVRVCGVQFACQCLKTFTTYEALLTHAKRHSHVVDGKYKVLSRRANLNVQQPLWPMCPALIRIDKPITILPNHGEYNTANGIVKVEKAARITNDVAVQTDDPKRGRKVTSPPKCSGGRRKESRQTQTGVMARDRRIGKSTETQTGDEGISKRSETFKARRRKKCNSEKRTEPDILKEDLILGDNFEAENLFPNSPLPLRHDVGFQDLWEEKNTSGTQTNPEQNLLEALSDGVAQTDLGVFYDHSQPASMHCGSQTTNLNSLRYVEDASVVNVFSFHSTDGIRRADPMLTEETFGDRFSSIETQTDRTHSHSLFDPDALSRSFAISSNIETQTTENFGGMDQLLYSNTCTQTCDEILPPDLGLSNIQTQTAWSQLGDTTVSAETQTKISRCQAECNISIAAKPWLHTHTSHTETQTDLLNIFEEFQ